MACARGGRGIAEPGFKSFSSVLTCTPPWIKPSGIFAAEASPISVFHPDLASALLISNASNLASSSFTNKMIAGVPANFSSSLNFASRISWSLFRLPIMMRRGVAAYSMLCLNLSCASAAAFWAMAVSRFSWIDSNASILRNGLLTRRYITAEAAANKPKTAVKISDHVEIVSSVSRENADMVVILCLIAAISSILIVITVRRKR